MWFRMLFIQSYLSINHFHFNNNPILMKKIYSISFCKNQLFTPVQQNKSGTCCLEKEADQKKRRNILAHSQKTADATLTTLYNSLEQVYLNKSFQQRYSNIIWIHNMQGQGSCSKLWIWISDAQPSKFLQFWTWLQRRLSGFSWKKRKARTHDSVNSAQRVGFFNIGSGRVGYWTKYRVSGRVRVG